MASWFRRILDHQTSYTLTRKHNLSAASRLGISISFLLLVATFTVFNIATIGYDMQPFYTSNPNATEDKRSWYHNNFFTWGDDKLVPKCQSIEVPVGHQFFTTNLGLTWTVHDVKLLRTDDGSPEQRSSISYLNNNFTDCTVLRISASLTKADDSNPHNVTYWGSWMTGRADSVVDCKVVNLEGVHRITLKASYVPDPWHKVPHLIAVDNATTHASMWWGSRILVNYFNGLQVMMSRQVPFREEASITYKRADLLYFSPNKSLSIKDNDFFQLLAKFLKSSSNFDVDTSKPENGIKYYDRKRPRSGPLNEGLSLAKMFYSLSLVDLGNAELPNLLLDSEMLQYALSEDGNVNRQPGGPLDHNDCMYRGISSEYSLLCTEAHYVMMNQSYSVFANQTGPLESKNATIQSTYLCSVPSPKGAATIFLLVLVADFVIIQAIWGILDCILEQYATRKDPYAMHCEACIPPGRRPLLIHGTKPEVDDAQLLQKTSHSDDE